MRVFQINHNQILTDIVKEFEVVDRVENADRVLLWNDVTSFERGIIGLARRYKKPVIVLQHGRRGTSRYFPPFNEPITADKLLVWGERDKKSLVEAGHSGEKIKVCGTTVFSHLKPREKHEGINIVFSPEHWDRELEENKKAAKVLRREAHKNKWKIITKIIEGHDAKLYDNPILSDRTSDKHLDICADVLSIADIVVGISESTFELLAQSLDIPVVIIDEWYPKSFGGDERYANYRRIISEASAKANFKNLSEIIKRQLNNPEELKEQRRIVCVEEGGLGLKTLELIKNEIINLS